MTKALVFMLYAGMSTLAYGQSQNEYVRFYGKVLSLEDSSVMSATMRYEKLPYYDDMGIGTSTEENGYEFFLGEGMSYEFMLSREGFADKQVELTITDEDGDGMLENIFYMEPVPEEEEPDLITLENLIFDRGSDQISAVSHAGLDELAAWMDTRPAMIIQLEGHTDFAGNAEANMRLSQSRVEAVKEYLVKKGIKKNRVLTKAFGGTQPLITERTDEAKARNRRVEVRVISR